MVMINVHISAWSLLEEQYGLSTYSLQRMFGLEFAHTSRSTEVMCRNKLRQVQQGAVRKSLVLPLIRL